MNRKTYSQNWKVYNKVQTNEHFLFIELLNDLCKEIENSEYKFGRPKLPFSEMVFVSTLKVYTTLSLRRFLPLLQIAKDRNFISIDPSYASVSRFIQNKKLTPILKKLIEKSSLPLKSIETHYSIDSSGFSTSKFSRWFDRKHRKDYSQRYWLKCHIICGVKTQIIPIVEITDGNEADCKMLPELFNRLSNNFDVEKFSADKAYSSKRNLELIHNKGAIPYIPFKKNTTGKSRGSAIWRKIWLYFQYHQEEFMNYYHQRSNVETAFHMIKTKFGQAVRSKTKSAQNNEILLKILCHNICVLMQEIYELGIDRTFGD